MYRRIALTIAVCAQLALSPVRAAEPGTDSAPRRANLTLAQVIDQAATHDPGRDLPTAYDKLARARSRQADSWLAAGPSASLRHQSDQVGSGLGLSEWEAQVSLPLWHLGERSAAKAGARSTTELATAQATGWRLEVAAKVRGAVWDLALAEEQAQLARHAWQNARQLEADIAKRVKAGDLARSDLLLAQDETLVRQDDYLKAAQELAHAGHTYLAITGLQALPARIDETQSEHTEVRTGHPRLAQAEALVAERRAELERQRRSAGEHTALTIGTRQEKALAGDTAQNSVGISISVPFGGGTQRAPAIAEASLQLTEAEAARARVARELELALEEARHRLETLRAELTLSERQSTLARQHLQMMRSAFTLGEVDLATLLRTQNRAQSAERNYALRRLQLGYAIAQYNQAVGVMP